MNNKELQEALIRIIEEAIKNGFKPIDVELDDIVVSPDIKNIWILARNKRIDFDQYSVKELFDDPEFISKFFGNNKTNLNVFKILSKLNSNLSIEKKVEILIKY